jgi:FAD/FMN-containing dehydrogenase
MIADTLTSQPIREALAAVLDQRDLRFGADIPENVLRDWTDEKPGRPLALVTPRDTASVSAVLGACNRHGVPVVPQGGRSGLAGGAVASDGAVLLSLEKMNAIERVDPNAAVMIVQAGLPLQQAQAAAEEVGMIFAMDFGARGSAQIGGIISTNAGGNRVLRYGMTRELVLGIEVVLADGTILPMMNEMPKNNAALDLKHLFIGSEGMMGVITRAVLKLHPGVVGANTALIAFEGFDGALAMLNHAQKRLSGRVTAFELMWRDYFDAAVAATHSRKPLHGDYSLYAILDVQSADPDEERALFETLLEEGLEAGWIADAALAGSHADAASFWRLRDAIAEIFSLHRPTITFDVSVPQRRIGETVETLRAHLADRFPGLQTLFFGHAGDSNIHLVAGPTTGHDPSGHAIEDAVYTIIRDVGGSISAEHGIGLHKKPWLHFSRTEAELATLRKVKQALDPAGILNPGKVLPLSDTCKETRA